MHAALRQVLGDHVQQKGSLVSDEVLRFDFSHPGKVTQEELDKIEQIVNEKIRQNIDRRVDQNVPIDKAKEMGAMALFGEKYDDFVRVVSFDPDYSMELCGGTHVPTTGRIGYFRILSESSIAAGVRRIEAVTAERAEKVSKQEREELNELRELLKHPKDLKKAVTDLMKEKASLQKEVEAVRQQQTRQIKNELKAAVEKTNGMSLIQYEGSFPNADMMKQIAFELKNELDDLVLLIGGNVQGKPMLSVMLADAIVKQGYNAGQIIREMASEIQGGGGGQPFYATAGGKKLEGLKSALEKGRKIITEKVTN